MPPGKQRSNMLHTSGQAALNIVCLTRSFSHQFSTQTFSGVINDSISLSAAVWMKQTPAYWARCCAEKATISNDLGKHTHRRALNHIQRLVDTYADTQSDRKTDSARLEIHTCRAHVHVALVIFPLAEKSVNTTTVHAALTVQHLSPVRLFYPKDCSVAEKLNQ